MGRFPSRGAQEDSGMRESHGERVKRADAMTMTTIKTTRQIPNTPTITTDQSQRRRYVWTHCLFYEYDYDGNDVKQLPAATTQAATGRLFILQIRL